MSATRVCWVAVMLHLDAYVLPVLADDGESMAEWDTKQDAIDSMEIYTDYRALTGYQVFEVKS